MHGLQADCRIPPLPPSDLDAEVIAAHKSGDIFTLVKLYRRAGEAEAAAGRRDAAAFLLTQAYIFALHSGHPETEALHERLKHWGREA